MKIEKRVELRGRVIYRATLDLGRGDNPAEFLLAFQRELAKRRSQVSILENELIEKWERLPATGIIAAPRGETEPKSFSGGNLAAPP
jgi:hypothetical protein